MQQVQANGIQLAYEDSGSGTPLLLLHGLTANRHSFDGLLRAGLADGLRVIRVDLRGRGQSDKPDGPYTQAAHAADILGVLDALGLADAVFVGHSFGGFLSLYMAANHPQRVQKLVVIDAALEAAHPSTLEKIKPSLDRLGVVLPSLEAYLTAIKQSPYYADGFWDADLEAYYRADVEALPDGSVRPRSKPAHIGAAVAGVIHEDWSAHLAQVRQAGLLLHAPAPLGPAHAPPIVSQAGADEMLQLLPQFQYQAISGHHITMLFGDNAPKAVAAIRAFVDA